MCCTLQPIELAVELVGELLEQGRVHKVLTQAGKHAGFDHVATNVESVLPVALVAGI